MVSMQKIMVTGSAGFIGFHTADKLLDLGHLVIGVDSLNDYYDPSLKNARNAQLLSRAGYTFHRISVSDFDAFFKVAEQEKPDLIIHLAAQAGVRYSVENPWAYEEANLKGTVNVCEVAARLGIKRIVFASSSSVYGANTKIPFAETDMTDAPVSLYAATKKATENICHAYHALYGIEMAGLRFFTVYGEWGRPDMSPMIFSQAILEGVPIQLFNNGDMQRDFTYVDDVVDGIIAAAFLPELSFDIFNLGGDNPIEIGYFISLLEEALNKKAVREPAPMQKGDVPKTMADLAKSRQRLGYSPKISIEEGVKRFTDWYMEWHRGQG